MDALLLATLLLSGGLIGYHHLLYPILLRWLAARGLSVPASSRGTAHRSNQNLPTVTVVVPVHNEAAYIADKLRNLAILDYPHDKLRIIFGLDGCHDETAALLAAARTEPECRDLDVKVVDFAQQRGKIALLNHLVPRCRTDLVALTDASALVSIDALRIAARHFAESEVAAVGGGYRLMTPGSHGEESYWRYQSAVKIAEARFAAPIGLHGAFYVLRRHAYISLPPDTINDDLVLPMQLLGRGQRVVYEPDIVALELEEASDSQDLRRRIRIASGNLQQAIRLRRLLSPRHARVAFVFASGKILRVFMPLFFVLLFLASMGLALRHPQAMPLLALQLFAYGLVWLRHLGVLPVRIVGVDVLYYLVRGHVASGIGALRYLVGCDRKGWQRQGT